ncbi:MAG: DUF3108 domain-containing protein [Acidobacteriota bacterium]
MTEPGPMMRRLFLPFLLLMAIPLPSSAQPATEEFRYRWHLGSLVGRVAGLFLPNKGDGVMRFSEQPDGTLHSELLVTSEKSDDGEFWRYGSTIDRDSRQALSAWSAYRWRGKEKEKRDDIAEPGVLDIVSGIWALRQDTPERPRQLTIWSDGKVYPVVVIPRGREKRRFGEREVSTRHWTIRGIDAPEGRRWKGRLELWLSDDEAALPVEIRISRSLADLRLELQPPAESQ